MKPGEPCPGCETTADSMYGSTVGQWWGVVYPGNGVRGHGAEPSGTPWYGSGLYSLLVLPCFSGKWLISQYSWKMTKFLSISGKWLNFSVFSVFRGPVVAQRSSGGTVRHSEALWGQDWCRLRSWLVPVEVMTGGAVVVSVVVSVLVILSVLVKPSLKRGSFWTFCKIPKSGQQWCHEWCHEWCP